ncbi:hypothetical protein GGI42DRAFT_231462 [Trichoderma sp. SZMC 28013]
MLLPVCLSWLAVPCTKYYGREVLPYMYLCCLSHLTKSRCEQLVLSSFSPPQSDRQVPRCLACAYSCFFSLIFGICTYLLDARFGFRSILLHCICICIWCLSVGRD